MKEAVDRAIKYRRNRLKLKEQGRKIQADQI